MRITWLEANRLAASGVPVGLDELRDVKAQGVGAILTLTKHPLIIQKGITAATFSDLDLIAYHAPVRDGFPPERDIAKQVIAFLAQMQDVHRATLVHCQAGVGRTGTILHLYYLAQGHDLEAAKQQVKTKRVMSSWVMLSDTQRQFLSDIAADGF